MLAASTDDEIDAFQVHRTIGGTTSSCAGTVVGPTFSTGFATNTSENPTATVVFIDTPATTSQVNYTVCSSVNSTGTVNNTTPKITVGLVELGADLAENYYTKDAAIGAGDIVSADPTLPAGAKKSSSAYDSSILGIVSTKPGAVLDDGIGLNQGRQIPVALSGRVPLKVTTENGVIKPGDLITSSSLQGVGMKATKAGQIVGQALTGFDGQGVGQVLVFVKTNFGQGDMASLASGLDSNTILGKRYSGPIYA